MLSSMKSIVARGSARNLFANSSRSQNKKEFEYFTDLASATGRSSQAVCKTWIQCKGNECVPTEAVSMARVKISEYRAKKILLGDAYKGVSVRVDSKTKLPKSGKWVAKVDQGVKKRFKRGLVAVGVSPAEASKKFGEWKKKGFSQFLLEPFVPHKPEEEQYISFERVREGIRILHTSSGGVKSRRTRPPKPRRRRVRRK